MVTETITALDEIKISVGLSFDAIQRLVRDQHPHRQIVNVINTSRSAHTCGLNASLLPPRREYEKVLVSWPTNPQPGAPDRPFDRRNHLHHRRYHECESKTAAIISGQRRISCTAALNWGIRRGNRSRHLRQFRLFA